MSTCKRALQRDKGPEVRAKEVQPKTISQVEWDRSNETEGEPMRVAWSYTWACAWMLRAIEAANLLAKDVEVILENKTVKLLNSTSESPRWTRRRREHGGLCNVVERSNARENAL